MSSDGDGTRQIKGVPDTARTGPGTPAVTHKIVPRGDVIRPGQYRNGENREGTPAGRESTTAKNLHYTHPQAVTHRAGLRGGK
jgi:hypothetical protein